MLAIAFASFLIQNVMKRSVGTPEMQNISNAIKEGAEAFLARQNNCRFGNCRCALTFCPLRIFA
ncbi:MAG: sodium/proton-translocating pyrophosphatase [Acidobacteria bacterium]|nr:sodium/proton-translocating pyrophosphatase [Acidobacteriota bacterium]